MNNIQIQEAKKQFFKTGRLNHKVVKDQISKSWYKCHLTHVNKSQLISKVELERENQKNNQLNGIVEKVFNLIGNHENLLIVGLDGEVVDAKINDDLLKSINHVDEQYLGTNGISISLRTSTPYKVSLDEHYLDQLCSYYSVGIPILLEDKMIGVIGLVSTLDYSEYTLMELENKLKLTHTQIGMDIVPEKSETESYELESLFVYPNEIKQKFKMDIKRTIDVKLPILIMGSDGSGKTTLALYLSKKIGMQYALIDAIDFPSQFLYEEIINRLMQNETVILENFELIDAKSQKLLTVYINEKMITNSSSKYSNYKCFNLILSTSCTNLDALYEININQRLLEKIKSNYILLKNLYDFDEEKCKLVNTVLKSHKVSCTDEYLSKLMKSDQQMSFKDIVQTVNKSRLYHKDISVYNTQHLQHIEDEKMMSYEEMERHYIEKVLNKTDYNLTLASEIMKISRSTLYRKIQKYQIDTKK